MANLRDIRTRITSIKNTQQITKAMKMVAAAKLRKAQQRMESTRPYAKKMQDVVSRLVSVSDVENKLLRKPGETSRALMIVIGSDRGLCGGFNNNLFRYIETYISDELLQLWEEGKLDLITIGRKADGYFKKRKYQVVDSHTGFFDDLNYENTSEIMKEAIQKFEDAEYDKVFIAFNEFKTVITQNRQVTEILPVKTESMDSPSDDLISDFLDYIYEPDSTSILDEMLPVHLKMQLWRAVLESNASEQGARMAAMDNATENAKELEQELRLKYNQARQSAITTEISEIVSGAVALEDS